MLPKILIEGICSLQPCVERFTFSFILTLTPDANIVSTRFTKSTIKSCAALSYVEAQALMDDSRKIDPLITDLRNLNSLAKLMRQRRFDGGAFTFNSTEVKFQMDTETRDPLDIGNYPIIEASQMIEEFMLACNFFVAKKILKHFPSCSLLRHQPAPTKEMLEPLHRMATAVGLDLDISSPKALMDSIDHVVGVDPNCKKQMKILATRCMTKVIYSWSGDMKPTEFHHFGLAAPLYTHFTSPMRRYADIIVHRLLAAALEISELPENFLDSLRRTEIVNNLNFQQINAKMASRASIYLHNVIYFKKRPMDAEARIIKIKPYGFIVFVPRFDIEGLICLTSRGSKGEEWILDEAHQRLSKKGTNISYCLLQMVRIHVKVVERGPYRPKLQFTLI
ncbi:exosome complex exonuclease DIS3/RRP44 [Dendrobium catenatum]|uniref:Exosome complex exonuclease DIS3/RRP44 n=2 Tax=Dendrobium catenatum TaxID=906689 RepID=A0A2I0WNG7_9ASPA|nr:exosome complex exonuclease DIS3/RRP44 [Dendrobium catenatum]